MKLWWVTEKKMSVFKEKLVCCTAFFFTFPKKQPLIEEWNNYHGAVLGKCRYTGGAHMTIMTVQTEYQPKNRPDFTSVVITLPRGTVRDRVKLRVLALSPHFKCGSLTSATVVVLRSVRRHCHCITSHFLMWCNHSWCPGSYEVIAP